jgi:hypothetical protein
MEGCFLKDRVAESEELLTGVQSSEKGLRLWPIRQTIRTEFYPIVFALLFPPACKTRKAYLSCAAF